MNRTRLRRISILSLPIIGGMASQNLFNLVDTAMVGYLGNAALAAVGLGGFVFFMCQAVILGISTGVQTTAARRKGEGRPERAVLSLNSALLIIVVVTPLLSAVLLQFVAPLYPYLNSDQSVIDAGVPYLEWRLAAMVFVGMNFSFRGYWNAMDLSRLYMFTLVIMHTSNIVLNYLLIFGKFGFPELGVTGAGIASAVSVGIGTLTYVYLGFRYARKDGFLRGLASRSELRALVRISIPSGLQQLFFAASFVLMFWIIGRIGTPELAVANVLITVTLFAILPGIGLGLACTTLVSEALGRGEPEEAYRWAWDVAKVGVVLLTILGLPMLLIPDLVSALFLHDENTRELARWPMRVVGLTMPIEALGFAFMHGLLGAGDSKRVMLISVSGQYLLFLPLAYLVGPGFGLGLFAVWLIQGGSRAAQALAFLYSWQGRRWQRLAV